MDTQCTPATGAVATEAIPCPRRPAAMFAVAALVLTLAGCASYPAIPEAGPDHPANPDAAAAPMAPLPDPLAVEAVQPPPQPPMMDMHEGHEMPGGADTDGDDMHRGHQM